MDMHIFYHLDALDGCLIFSLNYYYTRRFDGWLMKDNGVEKSWIKLFSLPLADSLCEPPRYYKLVAYLKGKEQVVLQYSQGFVSFDFENNSVLNFSVHCFPSIASSKICSGSLVRLKDHDSATGVDVAARRKLTKEEKEED